MGAHRPTHRGGGPDAWRLTLASVPTGHPAALASGHHLGGLHRVPLHLDLVRRGAVAGWTRDTTLEVEIYRQTAVLLDLPTAAALTLLQMVGVFVVLLASARAQEGLAVRQRLRAASETARRPRPGRERLIVGAIVGATVLFMATPLLILVERSLGGADGYSLGAYAALLEDDPRMRLSAAPWQAVVESRRPSWWGRRSSPAPWGCSSCGGHRLPTGLALPRSMPHHVAPGHFGGDRGFRVPGVTRHAAAGPAHVPAPDTHRPRPHRVALRAASGRAAVRSVDIGLRVAVAVLGASPSRSRARG